MIVVIFTKERNPRIGQMEQVASRGEDIDTLHDAALPPVSAKELRMVYDRGLREYILITSSETWGNYVRSRHIL